MKIMASSPITSWEIDGETVETVSDFILGAPVLWPPYAKSWLIGKDFDAGRDWGQEKKGTTGWDGWMASLTQWTRVWVNSGSWWWTGRPGVLWFMGSQRVGHYWATELNWTEYFIAYMYHIFIHSSVDGHLDCFHILTIVICAAVNIMVDAPFQIDTQKGDCRIIW